MFCSECGSEVSKGSKFCGDCGKLVTSSGEDSDRSDSTTLTEEIKVVKEEVKGQNKKIISIVLALAIFWFIAINPVQGNFFGITYLDFALADCGDSDPDDSSSDDSSSTGFQEWDDALDDLDDALDDLDEAVEESCRDSRSNSQFVVVIGLIGMIFLVRMAMSSSNPKSDKDKDEFRKLEERAAKQRFEEREAELAKERQTQISEIEAEMAEIESTLSDSRSAWVPREDEWNEKQQEIGAMRRSFSRLAIISVVSGAALGGSILLASALRLNIPEEDLQRYFSLVLYGSWSLPLVIWLRLKSNPILPKDHHLTILRDDISSMEDELSRLDSRLLTLNKVEEG